MAGSGDVGATSLDLDRDVATRCAELIDWLDGHTNFEVSMPGRAAVPTLERIRSLCHLLGDPERACPVVHITGTNGKGSTARILTELLGAGGLSVGTYTSPNLHRVNERIARNGEPIEDADLVEVLGSLASLEPMLDERPTRFELLTAAAFRWFADVAVDVAVVEVGLGGTWDATNVVDPEVAVVTNVSLDHVDVLGPTVFDIASEKAGIIKPGCRVVIGEQIPDIVEVFGRAAEQAGAVETWFRGEEFGCDSNVVAVGGRMLSLRTPSATYPEVYLALHGPHQGDNAACALAAAEAFFGTPLVPDLVDAAFGSVRVPGRLEVVGHDPLILLDGAHNVAGAEALADSLTEEFRVAGEVVAVVGMLEGRDPAAMVGALAAAGVGTVVACTAPSPRGMAAATVADAARSVGVRSVACGSVDEAVADARRRVGSDGLLLVTGSLYVVAEARAGLGGDLDGPRPSR